MKYMLLGILIFLIAVSSIVLIVVKTKSPVYVCQNGAPVVRIGEHAFAVEVADTRDSRTRGLSGKKTLPLREGMLFVFEKAEKQHFWMKDMAFPIHIIWIDGEHRIKGFVERAVPSSYPNIFYSPVPVPYVLEIHADAIADISQYLDVQVEFICIQKPAI